MNQSMLKQYNNRNKKLLTSLILIFVLIQCKKKEQKKPIEIREVKYVGANTGVRLSEEKQDKAFGEWKFTNVLYTSNLKDSLKISVNKKIIVNEQGVFDINNKLIAENYETTGTYQFINLDSLNSRYYVFSVDEKRMIMNSSNLAKVVNGKMTKERASIHLFFVKE